MAKRFTDTAKWDDPWFCALTPADKLFWEYLCDKCDHAGIWKVNMPLAAFHLGANFTADPARFSGRIRVIGPEKWFIAKFVEFQYGALNPDNRAHLSVISLLNKEGVSIPLGTKSDGSSKSKVVQKKVLTSPIQGDTDKEKDKEKDKDTDNDPIVLFDRFWKAYPRRDAKKAAFRAWQKLDPSAGLVATMLTALARHRQRHDWLKDGGQFIPLPATWLNGRRWEDESAAVAQPATTFSIEGETPEDRDFRIAAEKHEADMRFIADEERREKAERTARAAA